MKALKMVPLVLGVLLNANTAYAVAPAVAAGVAAALAAGLEGISQATAQFNSSANWATSENLTAGQAKQVDEAINYLKEKGFAEQAQQAQTMLGNSKSWFRSTFVYREGKSKDMALTSGGPVNAIFNNGHITLYRNFFDITKHDGVTIDTPDKRKRDQAQTLVHELEHLNTQANTQHIYLLNLFRDWEKDPIAKQVESLGALGYTPQEIKTIRGAWEKGDYKKYVKLIDKELAKPEPPKAEDETPPKTEEAKATEPPAEPKTERSPQKKDEAKVIGPGPDDRPGTSTLKPGTDAPKSEEPAPQKPDETNATGPGPEQRPGTSSPGTGSSPTSTGCQTYDPTNPACEPNAGKPTGPSDTAAAGQQPFSGGVPAGGPTSGATGGGPGAPAVPQPPTYGGTGQEQPSGPGTAGTAGTQLPYPYPPPGYPPSVGPPPAQVPWQGLNAPPPKDKDPGKKPPAKGGTAGSKPSGGGG